VPELPAEVCEPAPIAATAPGGCSAAGPDLLDEALAAAGLDRCSLGWDADDRALLPPELERDPVRPSWFDRLHDAPLQALSFGRETSAWLDAAAASARPVARAIQAAAVRLGEPVAVCSTVPGPERDAASPLGEAVARLIEAHGGTADRAALAADAADVPRALQQLLVPVLAAADAAAAVYERALEPLSRRERADLQDAAWWVLPGQAPDPRTAPFDRWALGDGFPAAEVYAAAARLAAAVEDARLERFAGSRGFEFNAVTPLGRVVLRDGAAHVHDPTDRTLGDRPLLLLDTGGDDTWLVAAGAVNDPSRPVALAIDLAGDDRYGYVEQPDPSDGTRLPSDAAGRNRSTTTLDGPVSLSTTARQGAARVGIGLLWDLGRGNDAYRSLRMSQGFGLFGVGVLRDDGGDDTYDSEAGAQGAALFGIGLLLDGGGHDVYRTYDAAQGFGGAGGFGALHDLWGDDVYFADPGDPAAGGDALYSVDQLPGVGNRSLAQGMGFGRRGDLTRDGTHLGGGLGVLRDVAGNDDYVCSVFCQGAGFWFGTGLLDDADGDDDYDALYDARGAGIHFALALFRDARGDDHYNQRLEPRAMLDGVGHDVAVGVHVDEAGDDLYRAPALSLGAGNANGIGLFVNAGGADGYAAAAEPTLGAGNPGEVAGVERRAGLRTVGLFVDGAGADGYQVGDAVLGRDGTLWSSVVADGSSPALGVGLDREGGVALP
jgi:hypothetical protein